MNAGRSITLLAWTITAFTTARRWVADTAFLAPVRNRRRQSWWIWMVYGGAIERDTDWPTWPHYAG